MELTKFERQIATETFNAQAAMLTTTEAMLAACSVVKDMQPAAQPFSVTLEEMKEAKEAEHVLKVYWKNKTSDEDRRVALNTILARRPAAQEASTVQYYCANCGHVSRHHDGGAGQCIGHAGCTCMRFAAQEVPTPSAQEGELVEIALRAFDGAKDQDYNASPQEHRDCMTAALAAVRSQIAAERDKAWEPAKVALEKLACLGNGPHQGNSDGNVIAVRALDAVRARLTPPQEPKERVVVCVHLLDDSFGGFDVRVDDQLIAQFTGKHEAERYAAGLRAEIGEKK